MTALSTRAECVCGWTGNFCDGLTEPRIPDPRPAIPYVSIDIETTGLNPETCQVLEIGAVYDDWSLPLTRLPRFHCYVTHKQLVGEPFALALNADILRKLTEPQPVHYTYLEPEEVAPRLAKWLKERSDNAWKFTPAGKNFASFDRQFLKRLPNFEKLVRLHHRTLDPAMLFWSPIDTVLPGSKTCHERAGKDSKVAHTALQDALDVVWLIRAGVKRLRTL